MEIMSTKYKQKTRVGIITLQGHYNYGNRLQHFATYSILKKLDLVPVSLDLCGKRKFFDILKSTTKKIIGIKQPPSPESLVSPERLEAFAIFDKIIKKEFISNPSDDLTNKFDFFITGSDQVWNPDYIRHKEDWFFLKFAQPEQRITLAPSIGKDQLTVRNAHLIAKGVAGFPSLSVREKKGAELIKQCSGRDAEVICDPTLVLTAREWRAVSNNRLTPEDAYVFTYLLGGVESEALDVLERATDHGRIPIISLSDRQKPGELDAGPAEFVDLIDHASHVVTDSFHAAVFSSILQTPLTIVRRKGGASIFSRLEQLSQMLGIEEKVYGSSAYDFSRAGNYMGVPEAIVCEQERFMAFLKSCLDEQKSC